MVGIVYMSMSMDRVKGATHYMRCTCVLTRVLTKQVTLYPLSVLVDIVSMS